MKYSILYSDIPWPYKSKKAGGSMTSGAAQKYPVIELEDIKALDIKSLCEKDALLFEWVPVPLMIEGVEVIQSWGFKYHTKIFWRKIGRYGTGYWFRGEVEELWLCSTGNVPALRCQERNFRNLDKYHKRNHNGEMQELDFVGLIQKKPSKIHSRKPEEARRLIEQALKGHPFENREKLELFATEKIEGWDQTGFEVDGKDIRDFISKVKVT